LIVEPAAIVNPFPNWKLNWEDDSPVMMNASAGLL